MRGGVVMTAKGITAEKGDHLYGRTRPGRRYRAMMPLWGLICSQEMEDDDTRHVE